MEDQSKKIEEIKKNMKCKWKFKCEDDSLFCKIKDIGMNSFLVCLDSKVDLCKYSIHFGNSYFCSCPLKFYLNKTED